MFVTCRWKHEEVTELPPIEEAESDVVYTLPNVTGWVPDNFLEEGEATCWLPFEWWLDQFECELNRQLNEETR